MENSPAGALVPFGFTALESQIYTFLAGETTATGYRIAQAIGKPVANTYKAIESLRAKGAIVVEDGDARQCRAVPCDELLDRIGREFEANRAAAKRALEQVPRTADDDRVYSIRSRAQALHRARQMLGQARVIALLAARHDVVEALRGEMADAAGRGVEVVVKTDVESVISRVEGYVVTREDDLLRHGSYLRLAVDAAACLAGVLSEGDEADVISTQSGTMARILHEGLAAEINLLAVAERLEDGAGPKRLARALSQVRGAGAISGGLAS